MAPPLICSGGVIDLQASSRNKASRTDRTLQIAKIPLGLPRRMLDLKSTVKLPSGHTMPLLGYGSYASSGEGVAEALKLGYRHIDSAQMYRNEANIGKAVASSGIPRSEIFLTTKYNPGAAQPAAKVLEALRPSLAKLDSGSDGNSGYIDLFLIHGPGGGEKGRAGNWEAMAQAQKEGWVRDIGVSNFGVRHLTNLPSPKPAVNQIEVHPFCQQRDIVEYCQKNGIVIQAYSPLILADKAKWGNETLVSISKKHERDIAQVLLRWSLQKGFVPLPKSSTPARIQSNAALYDFELDTEDMARLDKLDQGANGAVGWNPVDAP